MNRTIAVLLVAVAVSISQSLAATPPPSLEQRLSALEQRVVALSNEVAVLQGKGNFLRAPTHVTHPKPAVRPGSSGIR